MKKLEDILLVEHIIDAPDHPVFYSAFESIVDYIRKGQISKRIVKVWIASLDLKIHFSNSAQENIHEPRPILFDFDLSELDSSMLKIAQNRHLTVASIEKYRFVKRVLLELIK